VLFAPFLVTKERRGVIVSMELAFLWLLYLYMGGMVFNNPTWGYTTGWGHFFYRYSYLGTILALFSLPWAPVAVQALAGYSVLLSQFSLITYVPNLFSILPAIPVTLLSILGLQSLVRTVAEPSEIRIRRGMTTLIIVFFIFWCARASINYAMNAYPEVSIEDLDALEWVRDNTTGTVLGSVDISGVWITAYANKTSIVDGEFLTTPDFAKKENVTKMIYSHDNPNVVRELIDREGIDYIYLTERDPLFVRRGLENITKKFEQANLTLVFKNEKARVFRTRVGKE